MTTYWEEATPSKKELYRKFVPAAEAALELKE